MKALSLATPAAIAGIVVLASSALPVRVSADERTLDLSTLPMTIAEGGTYVVCQDWEVGGNLGTDAITVVADNVTIDLRGFNITYSTAGGGTALKIEGARVTVRNGVLGTTGQGSNAIDSSGAGTRVENMQIYSPADGLSLRGPGGSVRDSSIAGRFSPLRVSGRASVERNTIGGIYGATVLEGDGILFQNNQLTPSDREGALLIRGNDNTVLDNLVGSGGDGGTGIVVEGSANLLARNVVRASVDTIVSINGSRNTIEGTLAPPSLSVGGSGAQFGITFLQDGNFFGNNRLAASVPVNTNGTVQTDWGGNVGY
ncbi:MAG TPA: right-handed parallel beta-helix repeat-containing protein [Gammaproteobacteria bacterium]|nr:right-handed parallel beta-helix repeat-containing protein [Gammaproteobacteria bacterium]